MAVDIEKSFGKIWPVHVGALVDLMLACREYFEGDMDMFIILTVIGDRNFPMKKIQPGVDFNTWMIAKIDDEGSFTINEDKISARSDININSISAYTKIPRETVRRKIVRLIEIGWIERKSNGSIVVTDQCKNDLEGLTHHAMRYLKRMASVLT